MHGPFIQGVSNLTEERWGSGNNMFPLNVSFIPSYILTIIGVELHQAPKQLHYFITAP